MAHSTARRRAVNRCVTPARRLACPHRIKYFEQLYDDIHKQDGVGHYAGFPIMPRRTSDHLRSRISGAALSA
jgi:hypothetical protein